MTYNPIRACAELIEGTMTWKNAPARCNRARCGMSFCGDLTDEAGVYAGMLPVKLTSAITAALTAEMGGPADPRQRFDIAFDNPAFTLHIVGNDLVRIDRIAQLVIDKLDRTGHHDTTFGTVNGIRINPPKRTVRSDRPRYDVQLLIEMEMART